MPRNYKTWLGVGRLHRAWKQPRVVVRLLLGVLLAANLVAAVLAFHPFGGSPEDLERQLGVLRGEIAQKQAALRRLRAVAEKVDKARAEGDKFLTDYFVNRGTASSTIVSELVQAAKQVGMRPKEQSYAFDPVDGSDAISMMTITGGYEGSYADLVHFVNLIDRSPRFLIIEFLQAAPQASTGMLTVSMKLNTFVKEEAEAK